MLAVEKLDFDIQTQLIAFAAIDVAYHDRPLVQLNRNASDRRRIFRQILPMKCCP